MPITVNTRSATESQSVSCFMARDSQTSHVLASTTFLAGGGADTFMPPSNGTDDAPPRLAASRGSVPPSPRSVPCSSQWAEWYERIVALRRRGRIISRAPAQPQIARSRPQVPGCGPTRPRRQGRAWWGAPASTRLVTLARWVPLRQPGSPSGSAPEVDDGAVPPVVVVVAEALRRNLPKPTNA